MQHVARLIVLFAAVLAWPCTVQAQRFVITPGLGVSIQASEFSEIRGQLDTARIQRGGALGLVLGLEIGSLRATAAYTTGATISDDGIQNGADLGDGTVLALTGGFVLKLLPGLPIQPYALLGGGLKRETFSFEDDSLADLFPDSETDFAGHLGGGVALMLGGFGLSVELNDFISVGDDFGPHDVFVTLGLRLGR